MELTAKQIAEFLNGKIEGNDAVTVNKVCKIEEGEVHGLSFLANPKYTHYIYDTKASVVILGEDVVLEKPTSATLIRVKDAYSSFATLLDIYEQYTNANMQERKGISSLAAINKEAKIEENCYIGEFTVIDRNAKIGKNAKIYPQVYIGENVTIGDNVTIFAGVKIYHDINIGNNCIIHSGVVIGADGFGFAPLPDGTFKKIPQTGNVVIEDDVEIGANTCVDRSTMGATIIRKGTKVDNLCQIAHNVTIGSNTVMSAQTGLAGSTHLGSYCFVGGQVGFAGHLTVGDRAKIGAQSGVFGDVKEDEQVFGYPAFSAKSSFRSSVLYKKLPEIEKRLRELEQKIKQYEDNK